MTRNELTKYSSVFIVVMVAVYGFIFHVFDDLHMHYTSRNVGYMIFGLAPLTGLAFFVFYNALTEGHDEDVWHKEQDAIYHRAYMKEQEHTQIIKEKGIALTETPKKVDIRAYPKWEL